MKTVLKYNSPAKTWIEGLPLGNGSDAMMFFGEAKSEVFMLNHDRLWQGSHKKDFDTAKAIPALTELVKSQKGKEFHELFHSTVRGEDTACNSYQPFADLRITVESEEEAREYRRALDLENAVLSAEYALGENKLAYRAFSDFNSHVMRICFSAEAPVTLALAYEREKDPDCVYKSFYKNGSFIFEGMLTGGVVFKAYTQIITDAEALMHEGVLQLTNVHTVELRIVLATSLFTDDTDSFCQSALKGAVPYDEALTLHKKGFGELFNRCVLDLHHGDARSTEAVYEDGQRTGIPPLALYEQVADMARYVLICSSREGSLPCNLQGIWNHEIHPEWESGYTTDMNLQMYYWVANNTRLFECQDALFDWILSHKEAMHSNAKRIFGIDGAAYIPQYTDCYMEPTCWKDYGDFQVLWGGAASWLAAQFVEYYRYTLDERFLLEKAYPYMKECAAFYTQLLSQGEDGRLHLYISASPENFVSDDTQIIDTATMDIALIHELFSSLIEISDTFEIDAEKRTEWQRVLHHLVDYPIDETGTLLEWCDSRPPRDPGHRHLSHAYPLFPGKACYKDSALRDASLKALERRLAHNIGQSASWSYAWYSCCFARIGMPEKEKECMQTLLIGSVISNLLSMYSEFNDPRDMSRQFVTGRRIYQADAMLGYYAACVESIIQCHDNRIILLPSLIDEWREKGSLKGAAVYGGIVVDVEWENGALIALSLISARSCTVVLELPNAIKSATAQHEAVDGGYSVQLNADECHKFFF